MTVRRQPSHLGRLIVVVAEQDVATASPRGRFLDELIGDEKCARSSRSALAADFDADGHLEITTNNFNDQPYFYASELPRRNYLALSLQGTRSNRDAIGALVRVTTENLRLTRLVPAAGGYLTSGSKRLHFGLADDQKVHQVEILWPSGQRQTLSDLEMNRLHHLVEPESEAAAGDDALSHHAAP